MKPAFYLCLIFLSVVLAQAKGHAGTGNQCSGVLSDTVSSIPAIQWLPDNKPATYTELYSYIKGTLLEKKATLTRLPKVKSAQWIGPTQFKYLEMIMPQRDIAERFSRESLEYHAESQRDADQVALWTFINLGADQGAGKILESS